jgi:hypothetical protein
VVGLMVRFGVCLFFLPDVWICNLWRIDGLLGGVVVEDSRGDESWGAAPALSLNSLETVVVTLSW